MTRKNKEMVFRTLSGYRTMWAMVLFDLPVLTKEQRSRAAKFRLFLLDNGFLMMQLSCYVRYLSGKEAAERLAKQIGEAVPNPGKAEIIFFTDKQYENIVSFRSGTGNRPPTKPEQLVLF